MAFEILEGLRFFLSVLRHPVAIRESFLCLELALHALIDVVNELRVASRIHRAVTSNEFSHLGTTQGLVRRWSCIALCERPLSFPLSALLCCEVHGNLHLSVRTAELLGVLMQQLLVFTAASRKSLVLFLFFSRVRVRDGPILILQQADLLTVDPRAEEVYLLLVEGSDQIIVDDVTLTWRSRVRQPSRGPRTTLLLILLTATKHLRF